MPQVARSLQGEAGMGTQQSCPRSLQAAMLEPLCFTSGDAGRLGSDRLGSDGGRAESKRALEDRQHGCPGDDMGTGMQTLSLGSAAEGSEQLCFLCPFSPRDALFTLTNTCCTRTGKDLSRAGLSSRGVAKQG